MKVFFDTLSGLCDFQRYKECSGLRGQGTRRQQRSEHHDENLPSEGDHDDRMRLIDGIWNRSWMKRCCLIEGIE